MQRIAIFDLDGTLADTLYDLADAVNYGLTQLGYPVHPYEKYKTFVGDGVRKLCERALPDDKKSDTDKLLSLFNRYYNEHFLDKTTLYFGIRSTLDFLSENGITLAIATNKPQDFAVRIAGKLLSDYKFLSILGGCDERERKPSPQIINDILKSAGQNVRAFMIGDSNVDILTAKNAGITSIGCTWGFRTEKELTDTGADFIAHTPEDICKIISDD